MFCIIWHLLCNLKNVKNAHGGVLLLASNISKSSTLPWAFFKFFKLYKWYQIAQSITDFAGYLLLCQHLQMRNSYNKKVTKKLQDYK